MADNYELDCVVGTIAYDTVMGGTAASMLKLEKSGCKFVWRIVDAGGYVRTVNVLLTQFLQKKQAPYFIKIDRDITFTPQDFNNLLEDLRNGYDLVGGCYAVKDGTMLTSHAFPGEELTLDGKVKKVKWLAGGFMGISRKLLESMIDELSLPCIMAATVIEAYPFFEEYYYNDPEVDAFWLSDDYSFCMKARKLGVDAHLDTRILLGHMGQIRYDVSDVISHISAQRLTKGLQAEAKRLNGIVGDIAEFRGISTEDVTPRIQSALGDEAEAWHNRTGSVKDYYRNNEFYLYGVVQWNSQAGYFEQKLMPLLHIKNKHILDIGCGIGTAVFMLAEQGNDVTGYDINNILIDFCNFKKQKYNLNAQFITELPHDLVERDRFDVVIAMDTLEHIENLPAFLKNVADIMKPNGKLYHADQFKDQEASPMHFDYSESIDKYLEWAGFVIWDDKWAIKR